MTIEALKETAEENRRTLEEDAEDTGQSFIVMTNKDGKGLVLSAGSLEDLANMAANMLMMIFKKRGGKLAVLAGVNGLDVDGRDGRVYIAKEVKGAELILQPDGSVSIVGEGITILIRTEDPIATVPDEGRTYIAEPTIERLGPSEDRPCAPSTIISNLYRKRTGCRPPGRTSGTGWPPQGSAASSAWTSRPSASTCMSATAIQP